MNGQRKTTNYADQPMKGKNAHAYNLTVAMELAILDCEEMGLEVERVEFDGRLRPRIFVRDCAITRNLVKTGKAQHYGTTNRNGIRHYLIQMPSRDCKILWTTDQLLN